MKVGIIGVGNIVCENGVLKIGELEPEIGMKEAQYRTSSKEFFRNLYGVWKEEAFEKHAAK